MAPKHSKIEYLVFLRLFIRIVLALMLMADPVLAQDAPLIAPLDPLKAAEQQNLHKQALAKDREAIDRLRQEIDALKAGMPERLRAQQSEQINGTVVEQAGLDTRSLQLKQEDLKTSIANAERQIKTLEKALADLEAQEQLLENPAKGAGDSSLRNDQLERTRQALTQQRTDLELEQENLTNLVEHQKLNDQRLALARQWQSHIEELYRFQQQQNRQEAQQELIARLEKEQRSQQDEAAKLRAELEKTADRLSEPQLLLREAQIQNADETAKLYGLDIRLSKLDGELAGLQSLAVAEEVRVDLLRGGLKQLSGLQAELKDGLALLERKTDLLRQQQEVIQRREATTGDSRANAEEAKIVADLLDALNKRSERMHIQFSRLNDIKARLDSGYKEKLNRDLLARVPLFKDASEWREIAASLVDTPGILFHQIRLSAESALGALAGKPSQWLIWAVLELALLSGALLGRRYLAATISRNLSHENRSFLDKFVSTVLRLLRSNLWGITVAVSLLLAIWLFQVPQPGLAILTTLVLLWVGIKIPIDLAWLVLATPRLPPEQRHPRLFRQLLWSLLLGGALAGTAILSHLSGVPKTALQVFEQLFTVYWLLVLHPLLRVRGFLLERLADRHANQLWYKSLRLLSLLTPLTLAVAALLGLMGYLNLGWTVIWYTLVFAGILTTALIIRGLLDDVVIFLKNYAAERSSYGLLWTQEVITPLHRTLHIILLLGLAFALLAILNWQARYIVPEAIPWKSLLLIAVLVLLAYELLFIVASYAVERSQSTLGGALIRHTRRPIGLMLPTALAQFFVTTLGLPEGIVASLRHVLGLAQIVSIAWLIASLVSVAEELIERRYLLETKDNLGARRIRTQVQMMRRIVLVTVYLLAVSAMLMTFPKIRQFGTGLLASAGVAGLVIGMAARPFLENLIAGIQIGLTQPIRIDDVVIVEGEWGKIAEINATHVVVHLWDDRRLVVPLNFFNTQPFQNWTRSSSELLGTAFFRVDYTFPVEQGRLELKRILDSSGLWDGRVWALQVTDTSERTVELRALMSAPDASTAWDLRCHVREKFIEFLQQHYPQCLPKTRLDLQA